MIKDLEESIKYIEELNKNNPNKYDGFVDMLEYNIVEGRESLDWYKAILEKVKKYNPKRVIDIGSNLNLFGYLFANEGIEYIGIDICKEAEPIQTDKIKYIHDDYYNVRDKFKNDICISCLCVGYLIPIKDVKAKKLIIDSCNGCHGKDFICTAKEVSTKENNSRIIDANEEIKKVIDNSINEFLRKKDFKK